MQLINVINMHYSIFIAPSDHRELTGIS